MSKVRFINANRETGWPVDETAASRVSIFEVSLQILLKFMLCYHYIKDFAFSLCLCFQDSLQRPFINKQQHWSPHALQRLNYSPEETDTQNSSCLRISQESFLDSPTKSPDRQ